MSDRKHALLGPSGAHRWMVCPPSARLESKLPDNESDYAREGTLAHELAEACLRLLLGWITQDEFNIIHSQIKKHRLYSAEMIGHCQDYASYVHSFYIEFVKDFGDAVSIFLEMQVNLRKYARGSYGHLDAAIAAPGILMVFDFKYGQGVPVSAEENEQMMCYALGCLEKLKYVDDYGVIVMHIIQPRLNNTSNWAIFKERLMKWATTELSPVAALAYAGEGEYVAGDHCKFCRAKPTCKVLANHIDEITKGLNYELPELLTAREISKVLKNSDLVLDYIKSVKAHALSEALKGKKFPGYKIVEGISRRVIANPTKAEKLLSLLYDKQQYTNSNLKGIGELEALIGKKDFDKVLGSYIKKPKGAPALVPDTDKRIAFGSAADVFRNIVID
jgi:hypothetical protein